jgi:hypothetical protein
MLGRRIKCCKESIKSSREVRKCVKKLKKKKYGTECIFVQKESLKRIAGWTIGPRSGQI